MKVIGAVIAAFVLIALAIVMLSAGKPAAAPAAVDRTNLGSTNVPNSQWFSAGIKVGLDNHLQLTDTLVIKQGQNQVSWKNNTGTDVFVTYGNAQILGVATSTFKMYVGTSTAATVTNTFAPGITAPLWSQFIDGVTVATNTPSLTLFADNITNHKTAVPGTLRVTNGQYLVAAVETYPCTPALNCSTATSSTRGWQQIAIPFEYYIYSAN